MRKRILLAVLVVILVAFGIVKWDGHAKAKKLATVQAEYDKLDLGHDDSRTDGGMFDEDKVAELVDWFGNHHIAMKKGYYRGEDVGSDLYSYGDHEIEGEFWRGCGNAEIAACRGVKFEWGKHGITLPIKDFDGKDPDWWLALRLSKLSIESTDHAYEVWQTEEAVWAEVAMAQEDPAYYLTHPEKSGSCRLDGETVSKVLKNLLYYKFSDETATVDRDEAIADWLKSRGETIAEKIDALAIARADLTDLQGKDWKAEYRRSDRTITEHAAHEACDQKLAAAEQHVRDLEKEIRDVQSPSSIVAEIDSAISKGRAHQALLDKAKKELKARLYRRTK